MLCIVVVTMVVAASLARPHDDTRDCHTYCVKPEGRHRGSTYCCGPDQVPYLKEEKHRGVCEAPLKRCSKRPAARTKMCPHDGHCPTNQKCCFDTCLDYHTCKPPLGL
ncbi:uncharacterized protein [Procambarus clarkii]|uniref:uncharacterized protein n=1 Tax=Procambarus clarkii TaxID=6728 RepID=UPI001E676416|nr:uncharacterized protein LOC123768292 [Procambarus clarkii]